MRILNKIGSKPTRVKALEFKDVKSDDEAIALLRSLDYTQIISEVKSKFGLNIAVNNFERSTDGNYFDVGTVNITRDKYVELFGKVLGPLLEYAEVEVRAGVSRESDVRESAVWIDVSVTYRLPYQKYSVALMIYKYTLDGNKWYNHSEKPI